MTQKRNATEKKKAVCFILLFLVLLSGCRKEISFEETEWVFQAETGFAEEETLQEESDVLEQTVSQTEEAGYVDVSGAVVWPGIYPVKEGMRLFEVIELAGGLREDADADWINQAEYVQDGQKIIIYTTEETAQQKQTMQSSEWMQNPQDEMSADNGKININTAQKEELMQLPGIGEIKAEAIIAYRDQYGPFSEIEGLCQVPGIKDAVFLKIKDRITAVYTG